MVSQFFAKKYLAVMPIYQGIPVQRVQKHAADPYDKARGAAAPQG
jgi:hypothetical protein